MKKSITIFAITFLLTTITGCELVRRVPDNGNGSGGNTNNPDKGSITEHVEKKTMNPSDHIFDIDLEKIRKDLTEKSININDTEITLSPENIVSSEFGGADLHDGQLRSFYHLIIQEKDSENRYEVGLYLHYNWTDAGIWEYESNEKVYAEALTEDKTALSYEERQELKNKYDTRPPDQKPDIIEETPEGEVTENGETAEGEITEGEEGTIDENIAANEEETVIEETPEVNTEEEITTTEEETTDEEVLTEETTDEETPTEDVIEEETTPQE